jgi:hypothetical protein
MAGGLHSIQQTSHNNNNNES